VIADPERYAYAAQIATMMDARKDRIGDHAAEHAPPWAVAALGPVPWHPLDRLDWQRRAASIGAWRELSGHDDSADPIGPEPVAAPDARAARHEALAALGSVDGPDVRGMPDEAIAWSVQAKTARWAGGFVEAAEFARRGFEVSAPTPTRVELAYREANAIALFGDAPRARKALQQAERAAETLSTGTQGASVWSFPPGRQAVFSLSVALHTGDASGALSAAATAEASWRSRAPKALATWAQVRAGAAMAYLMLDSLDDAAAQIAPVLDLAPEMRIDTVTGYLRTLDQMLSQPRFAGSALAAALRQQIGDFVSTPAAC